LWPACGLALVAWRFLRTALAARGTYARSLVAWPRRFTLHEP